MIGEEVRRRREEMGLTGAQLAARAGMAPSAVSQIETGRRSPSSTSVMKLAQALSVEVGDFFPKAQVQLPLEQPLTERPEVREWLRERGAKFALMAEAEFSELVLNMETRDPTDGDALLEGIEDLIEKITVEDRAVERALTHEWLNGGELFPDAAAGPDHFARAVERRKAVTQLQRAFVNEYQVFRLALTNYSKRLYSSGRTSNYLGHPKSIEIERQQMLEEAFAEELIGA